ncbi:hypothetical protein [Bradyrhizobium stylosanthis]|uniref:Uncharacterized protein n=1 Tax=Bradyrhizobium stylosanthis TaxID=1803665 RepID=A0A560DJY4_9BRAD|nr:hypothetical protein [Bradyrhizobium stylosanthis]TWA97427.1 hypothetical protein FBZ96_106483 [Bradyrhizobium stylosanthis]
MMSIKPLPFVGTDLGRARQILKSWTSLRRLTSDETDIVVRMIAQGLAEGRKHGFELAGAEGPSASQDYVDELPDTAGAQS